MAGKTKASKYQEQLTLFKRMELLQAALAELALLHVIPNGGHQSKIDRKSVV